ncbi:MAG: SPOR domain-containing protein [Candidatus Margulisiibacteriota bacterium]|nr:SPOR domain-containing protein [Candidatus Margulisiibacteriota bacterium]
MRWLKNILLVVLLIAIIVASFWVSFLVGKQMLSPVKQNPLRGETSPLVESEDKMTFEVVTETIVSGETTSKVQPEKTKIPEVKEKVVPAKTVARAPAASAVYKVQAGAFSSYTNAVNLKDTLLSSGYPAVVEKSGGLWKVKIGPYYSYASARSSAERLTAKGYEAIVRRER